MNALAQEVNVLGDALNALGRTTGLRARLVRLEKKYAQHRPDAEFTIDNAGKRHRFVAEVKNVDRTVALAGAQQQLKAFGKRGVLIAPYITPELAKHCREKLDLQFVDTAGNAYLRGPGLYVLVQGERPPGVRGVAMGAKGGGTAAALRVVFALLCNPVLLNAPYREIVKAAGVALGAVGWVFYDLERRGYVMGGKRKRNRRLLEPEKMLEEWVTTYPVRLRPKLNNRRFRALEPIWWQEAVLPDGMLWGGEVAANRMTGYLKPATATIYVDTNKAREALTNLVTANRLRADPEGEIEVLERFWNFEGDMATRAVPPLLVYADLLGTLDPRNLEVAEDIKKKYLNDGRGFY
jgi:hypothetical protein